MDYIKKSLLRFLSQHQESTIGQLEEHILSQELPTVNQGIIYNLVKLMDGVVIVGIKKIKMEELSQVRVHLKKEANYRIKKIDRIRLYIEDEETISVLERLYDFIINAGPEGISYIQLQQSLQKTSDKKLKLQINQISHYCRKLYNFGFIYIIMRQHFKIAIARKCAKVREGKKVIIEQKDEEDSVIEILTTNICSVSEYQNRNSFYFHELPFFQNLYLNLTSNECLQKEGLTLQEIQQRMNKVEEKKSLSRLFEILCKDGELNQLAERQGKIFSYRYKMRVIDIKESEQPQKLEIQDQLLSAQNLIEFDDMALQDLIACLRLNSRMFDNSVSADKTLRYLNELSIEHQSKGQRRKTQPSRQKFNRFTTIINILYDRKVTKQIEIKNEVIRLESDAGIGKIDGRTIQGIFQVLQKVGFCYTLTEKVVIASKECDRILFVHHSVKKDDLIVQEGLQDLKNINLGNQFKKQTKREKDEYSSESTPQKRTKIDNLKISRSLQSKVKDYILQNNEHDIYHSDESQQPQIMQEKNDHFTLSKHNYKAMVLSVALCTIIENNHQTLLKQCFIQLLPCYQIEAANYVLDHEETSIIQLCDGVEQMLRLKIKEQKETNIKQEIPVLRKWDEIEEETNDKLRQWEIATLSHSQLPNKAIQNLPLDAVDKVHGQSEKIQVYQAYKQVKNSLLCHPYLSLSSFQSRYPIVDLDVFLKKCLLDNTIELSYRDYQLNQETILDMVEKRECLDKIYISVQNDFLAYFV